MSNAHCEIPNPGLVRATWLLLFVAAVFLPGHGLLWNHGRPHLPNSPAAVRVLRDIVLIVVVIMLAKPAWHSRNHVHPKGWMALAWTSIPAVGVLGLGLAHWASGRHAMEILQHEFRNPWLYATLIPLSLTLFISPLFRPSRILLAGIILGVWFLGIAWFSPEKTMEWADGEHTARLIGHFERGPNLAYLVIILLLWSLAWLHAQTPFITVSWIAISAACIVLSASLAGWASTAIALVCIAVTPDLRRLVGSIKHQCVIGAVCGAAIALAFSLHVPIASVSRIATVGRSWAVGNHGPDLDWSDHTGIREYSRIVSTSGPSSGSSRIFQHQLVCANFTGRGWFSPAEVMIGDLGSATYSRFDSQYLNTAYNSGIAGLALLLFSVVLVGHWWLTAWRRGGNRIELQLLLVIALLIVFPFWLTAAFQQRYPMNLLACLIAARIWWLAFRSEGAPLKIGQPQQ